MLILIIGCVILKVARLIKVVLSVLSMKTMLLEWLRWE